MVQSTRPSRPAVRALLVALAAATTLTACNVTTGTVSKEASIFREQRLAGVAAVRGYGQCVEEGKELDAQARRGGTPGRYLAAARLLDKCEAELGDKTGHAPAEERMRAYALAITNYVKAGDLVTARARLDAFKEAFDGSDLYFPDGASFTETMEVIVGLRDKGAVARYAILNANGTVKAELRRIYYWQNN
ncbi:MAG: hypothetical protein FJX11_18340 [Alphaproteobacteria bacterium]|nr:hypothetical protein [Alphaproteobacteria bacterium]